MPAGAFAKVQDQRGDAFLLMVGGLPEQVDYYRELAETCGLRGHCLFTGRVAQATAKQLVSRATVLTSPRTEGTNTPLKIYEQLASGKSLVATRIPSHTQVLTDDLCILVDPTPESMAQGILVALGDEEKASTVAKGAKALYDRDYSRSAYESKMHRLLEALR